MSVVALVVGAVDVVLAVVFVAMGVLGIARRLPRNREGGPDAEHTMRSELTFQVTHAAAGPGFVGAGAVAAFCATMAIVARGGAGAGVAVVGLLAAVVLGGAAASFGIRAAGRLPLAESDGCGGHGGGSGCGTCVLRSSCAATSSSTPA